MSDIHRITVKTRFGGFNVKFDSLSVSIPYRGCRIDEIDEKLPPLLEDAGCSQHQIEIILEHIRNRVIFAVVEQDESEEAKDDPEDDSDDYDCEEEGAIQRDFREGRN